MQNTFYTVSTHPLHVSCMFEGGQETNVWLRETIPYQLQGSEIRTRFCSKLKRQWETSLISFGIIFNLFITANYLSTILWGSSRIYYIACVNRLHNGQTGFTQDFRRPGRAPINWSEFGRTRGDGASPSTHTSPLPPLTPPLDRIVFTPTQLTHAHKSESIRLPSGSRHCCSVRGWKVVRKMVSMLLRKSTEWSGDEICEPDAWRGKGEKGKVRKVDITPIHQIPVGTVPTTPVCDPYVLCMWLVCGRYVVSLWSVCGRHVVGMWLYVVRMWSVCGCMWSVRGQFMVSMWSACGWYVVGMWSVCGRYMVCMLLVCGQYVVGMWLVFGWYVVDTRSICGRFVVSMLLVCGRYAVVRAESVTSADCLHERQQVVAALSQQHVVIALVCAVRVVIITQFSQSVH